MSRMPSRSRCGAVAPLLLVLSGSGVAASAAPADSLASPPAEPVPYRRGLLTRGRCRPAVEAKRYTTQILRWWTAWGTIPGH